MTTHFKLENVVVIATSRSYTTASYSCNGGICNSTYQISPSLMFRCVNSERIWIIGLHGENSGTGYHRDRRSNVLRVSCQKEIL